MYIYEILAADESAPVFNIEDSIRETRNSLFAELDATNPPAEPSQKWREALRQPSIRAIFSDPA